MNRNAPKKKWLDYIVIGGALFSMFFGSGNLVFPPQIGISAGTSWVSGFIAYFIVDAGFAIMTVLAMAKADGDLMEVNGSIGRRAALVISMASLLCIGPGLAIPRNGAVAYEVGFAGMTGIDPHNRTGLAIFSIVFFAIVLLLTIRPTRVVDIVGKILTPVLVITLIITIISGVMHPRAEVLDPVSETVIKDGVQNGYQTLDLMAAMFFSFIAIQTVKDKGYNTGRARFHALVPAGLISCALLFIVYGGLSYLGASTGSTYTEGFFGGSVSAAQLLTYIANDILGTAGRVILGIVVLFACLTTAIGLISATGAYFSDVTNGRLTYERVVIFFTVFSAVLCNVGLSNMIRVSAPILMLIYPVAVFTVASYFFRNKIRRAWAYRLGGLVTFLVSLADSLDGFGVKACSFIHSLPFDNLGFNWLIPCLIAFAIGLAIPGPMLPETRYLSEDVSA